MTDKQRDELLLAVVNAVLAMDGTDDTGCITAEYIVLENMLKDIMDKEKRYCEYQALKAEFGEEDE